MVRRPGSIIREERTINPHHDFLAKTVEDTSVSFQPLKFLPLSSVDPFYVYYLFVRLGDEIEDNRNIERYRKDGLINQVRAMLYGDKLPAKDLEREFRGITPTEEKFRGLLNNITTLFDAHEALPEDIKKIGRKHIGEMTEGLRSPNIREYSTLLGYHQYCHFTTGVVGYLIADLLFAQGHLDSERLNKAMPDSISREIGVNPAHDWGVALQLGNDVRDLHKDISEEKFKWPIELFNQRGVSYDDIKNMGSECGENMGNQETRLEERSRRNDRIESIHELMCYEAEKYYRAGIGFLEALPSSPKGILRCFGAVYGFAGATLRVVKDKDFLYRKDKRDISKKEAGRIVGIVRRLTEEKKDIRPFMNHLTEKHAAEYKA